MPPIVLKSAECNISSSSIIGLNKENAKIWAELKTALRINSDNRLLLKLILFFSDAHGIHLKDFPSTSQREVENWHHTKHELPEHDYSRDYHIVIHQTEDETSHTAGPGRVPDAERSRPESEDGGTISVWLSGDEEDGATTDHDVTSDHDVTTDHDVTMAEEEEEGVVLTRRGTSNRSVFLGDFESLKLLKDDELDKDDLEFVQKTIRQRRRRGIPRLQTLQQLKDKRKRWKPVPVVDSGLRLCPEVQGMDGALWRDLVLRGGTDAGIKRLSWVSEGQWQSVGPPTHVWDDVRLPSHYQQDPDLVEHIACSICGHRKFRTRLEVSRHFWEEHPETRERNPSHLFSTKNYNIFAHCALCFHMTPFCAKVHLQLVQHVDHQHVALSDAVQQAPHVCDSCGEQFQAEPQLDKHEASAHPERVVRVFACVMCGETVLGQQRYIRHLQLHYTQYKYACSTCPNFRSRDPETMLEHVERHDRRYLQCDQCPQRSRIFRTMVDHMRGHLGKPSHVCAICGYQANTSSRYHNHMDSHGERRHTCQICGEVFNSLLKKSRHKLLVHLRPAQTTCDKCGRLFSSRAKLRRHQEHHAGIKRFQCQYCDKRLSSRQSLASHVTNTCPNVV